MGQYRQWLYHREVDQQLHTKLATLQQEMRSIQEQAALLEDAASEIDNPIIHAIAMQQSSEALLAAAEPAHYTIPTTPLTHPTSAEQPSQSISAALFAWSHLPNLDTEEIHLQATWAGQPEDPQPVLQAHPEANLLPEDLVSFIDSHSQTIPKLATYSHLSPAMTTQNSQTTLNDLTDLTDHIDRSIQRWVERWGHKPPESPQQAPHQPQHPSQEEPGK